MSYPLPENRANERKKMKVRSDSPFAKLTEDQRKNLLVLSRSMSLMDLCKVVEGAPEPIRCSVAAMRKFIRRLEQENLLEEAEEDADMVADFAKRGQDPAVRDATLGAMQQRMFENAFETNNRELMMEMFQAMQDSRAREQDRAIEDRKVKVLEENAKLGWRKLELENARAGLKLLPKAREILMDASLSAEQRVAGALQALMQVDAVMRMLPERTGETTPVAASRGLPEAVQVEGA